MPLIWYVHCCHRVRNDHNQEIYCLKVVCAPIVQKKCHKSALLDAPMQWWTQAV